MGLDIVAINQIKFLRPEDEDWSRNEQLLYPNPDFEARACGLKRGVYSFKHRFSFRAGPYSSYNRWRAWLAEQVGINDIQGWWETVDPNGEACISIPFGELLFFSDCEGTIGTRVCAKLAKDFDQWELGNIPASQHPDYLDLYEDFHRAFTLASDNGAVHLH